MKLPADLLSAVAAPGGGKITLVVGAGCSFEEPTSIPLAGDCSQECHDRLVSDGIISVGDCASPRNLSCLADAVFAKTHNQRALVEQLSQFYALKAASPNEGHLLAAALLGEGAVASVVTLNFDLALSTAISQLGVGETVGIIDGPDDFQNQRAVNLYYLHRNANAANPESWVLRTAALETEWKGGWEHVVTAKVMASPVVVFVGLGSPADVLIESAKLVQGAIPTGNRAYQVDPGDPSSSAFFKALGLDLASYIPGTWCDFMAALSQRLVVKQASQLQVLAASMAQQNHLPPENIDSLLERLLAIGLLRLGILRANWLLYEKSYLAASPMANEPVADLLLAVALIARVTGTTASLFDDGLVEFRRGDRTVATHVFVSGRGVRSCSAIEGKLAARKRYFRGRGSPPSGAVIVGARDVGAASPSPPPDVVMGDVSNSIVLAPTSLPVFHVESLRQDTTRCQQVAP